MGLIDDLDRRREEAQRNAENAARLAQSYAIFTTQGQGTLVHGKRIAFGTTFLEQPMVAFGCVVDLDTLADLLDVEDTENCPLPNITGFVTEWDQDDRGFYTGCWVAVRVHYPEAEQETLPEPSVDIQAQPEFEHHFTFQGVAMKDIPTDTTDTVD